MLFDGSPAWLPLPRVALNATGFRILAIKMPQMLRSFGNALAGLHNFTGVEIVSWRLDSCLGLEMLLAIMFALHHELVSAGCVCIVSDECVETL